MSEMKRSFHVKVMATLSGLNLTSEMGMIVACFALPYIQSVIKWRDESVHIIFDPRYDFNECVADLEAHLQRLETMPFEEWGVSRKEMSRFQIAPTFAYDHKVRE